MDKSIRISKALVNHRLAANVLDLIVLIITTLILYLGILYLILGFGFGYNEQKKEVQQIEESFSLTLGEEASYLEYQTVLEDFYFKRFPEEICQEYKSYYDKDYTIRHIYNIVVLGLPAEPTYDSYKTSFYQYAQKEDGTFHVDGEAVLLEGSGKYYEKNMHDLFYTSYKKLDSLLEEYHSEYYALKVKNNSFEMIARGVSFGIAFILLYILIPILQFGSSTLFEKKFSLAYVHKKDGYCAKKWKVVFKNIVYLFIPFIGFLLANKYSIVILSIGYLFLDHLILLFSKNNCMLEEMIFRIEVCSVKESLLYKSKEDEEEHNTSKEITDADYMEKLKNFGQIKITENNEEL